MEFNRYIRKPFIVQAVEITDENIAEIAELVGLDGVHTRDGQKYIPLDRRVVPNVSRAFVGCFLTKMEDNYRCYFPKVFHQQFGEFDDVKTFTFDPNENKPDASNENSVVISDVVQK